MNVNKIIEQVYREQPKLAKDNTKFCLAVWERVIRIKYGSTFGIAESIKDVIREFKPETIVRKRRELADPTEHQRQQEIAMHNRYTKKSPYVEPVQSKLLELRVKN